MILSRRIPIALVVAVAVVGTLAVAEPSTAASIGRSGLRYDFVAGEQFSYDLKFSSHSNTDLRILAPKSTSGQAVAGSSLARRYDVMLGGRLEAGIVSVSKNGFVIAYRLPHATVQIAQDQASSGAVGRTLAANLARWIFANVTRTGVIESLRADPSIDPAALRIEREILGLIQFGLPGGDGRSQNQWRAVEEDPSGQYSASYVLVRSTRSRGKFVVSKSKLGYAAPGSGSSDVVKRPTVSSRETIVGVLACGCMSQIDGTEVQTASFMGHIVAVTNLKIGPRLRSESNANAAAGQALLATFSEMGKTSSDAPLYQAQSLEQVRRSARTNTLGSETFASLMAELSGIGNLSQQQAADYYLKFRALEYLHPAECAAVGAALAQANASGAIFDVLSSSLGNVDSPEAQRGIVSAIDARKTDEVALLKLAPLLGFYPHPIRQAQDTLQDLATRAVSAAVAQTAQLALGAMARSLLTVDAARSHEIIELAIAQLSGDRSEPGAIQLLLVLGNSGSPDALDTIEGYLTNSLPELRANAAYALRFIQDTRAARLLKGVVSADRSAVVRSAALRAYKFQATSADVVSVEAKVLATDADPGVRCDALGNLWDVHNQVSDVVPLVRAASHDASSTVRDAAAKIMSSNPGLFAPR